MSSLFRDLQTAVRDRLKSVSAYGGPLDLSPVIEIEGDLDAQIERRIAATGLGLMVLTPKIEPGPAHDQITVSVVLDLIENPVQNQDPSGSRMPALEILESILAVLLDWQPSEAWSTLEFTGCELLQSTPTIVREATWRTTALLTLNPTT